jgi:uncharacterized membrane protein YeaQ/YmgE (transglycosylase-associated protein family)
MGLLAWLIVGGIAGWLAGEFVRGAGFGLIGDIVIGIVGALIGGYLAALVLNVANPISGFNIPTLVVAFVGAVILVWILGAITGRST